MKLTLAQTAYLAGLIDGEGCIECSQELQPRGATPRFVLRVSFTFATEEPLRSVCGWLGAKYRVYPATTPNRSPRYRAQVPKNTAVDLLRRCLPYLILKRQQAKLILSIESVRAEHTPGRKHFGQNHISRMPTVAINRMTALHNQLSALKSNKRSARFRR